MPRVKRGSKRRASRKKTLILAQGFFLNKSKLYRAAQEAVERSLRHGYIGRKHKKRNFRSLWVVRINAACRISGISYSRFIDGLRKAGIDLNRKMLAEIAVADAPGFRALVDMARAAAPQQVQ
ncbi:MAG: 50S ribosomal protein L20 [Bryobacteraceae bacterium]|nr:50S ribosomal protein L20 [Bryobacteraceae bacterium]